MSLEWFDVGMGSLLRPDGWQLSPTCSLNVLVFHLMSGFISELPGSFGAGI